jgi:hypothetical protein
LLPRPAVYGRNQTRNAGVDARRLGHRSIQTSLRYMTRLTMDCHAPSRRLRRGKSRPTQRSRLSKRTAVTAGRSQTVDSMVAGGPGSNRRPWGYECTPIVPPNSFQFVTVQFYYGLRSLGVNLQDPISWCGRLFLSHVSPVRRQRILIWQISSQETVTVSFRRIIDQR